MQYSIVKFNNIKNIFRLDAEYFHPFVLKYESLINQHHRKTFSDLKCKVVSGPFGSSLRSDAYIDSGVPFIRISDLKDFFIFTDNIVYISERDNNRLSSSQLKVGDLVLSKVGNTIGIVSKITVDIGNCNISENNLGIRFPRNISDSFRDYILSYLNSKIGQTQILRLISGNAQPKLNVYDIENLFFPIFSDNFYNQISNLIVESFKQVKSSKILYKHAEQLLLSELGLSDWKPKQELAFVKNFSDTQKAGRIDAEYFEPKYDEIIKAVKSYSNGWDIIGNVFRQSKSIFKIADIDKTYKYVEIGSINVLSGEIIPEIIKGIELPANAKIKLYKDDILISKVRAYRGAITFVMNNDFIGSGAFTVLKEKGAINKESLIAYFKSKPILNLTFKYNTGTAYPTLFDSDILNMPIPIFKKEVQDAVKEKIQKSFKCRELSKQLLEIAKRGVETAIEKSEEEAEKWINYNLTELNKI